MWQEAEYSPERVWDAVEKKNLLPLPWIEPGWTSPTSTTNIFKAEWNRSMGQNVIKQPLNIMILCVPSNGAEFGRLRGIIL
jgi:hypothetical protein